MFDLLFNLSITFGPCIALIPWIISIIWQTNKGLDTLKRRIVLGVWLSSAVIFTIVMYYYDPPRTPRREWDYSGLNFYLFGILANFGVLGVGGLISLFIPCPAKSE